MSAKTRLKKGSILCYGDVPGTDAWWIVVSEPHVYSEDELNRYKRDDYGPCPCEALLMSVISGRSFQLPILETGLLIIFSPED